MEQNRSARLIAFYLPQFHPIPENDVWWGKGFTEWTNVTKAKPLFRGHEQPRLPSDLGFYDLRVSEVREAQAELARDHGIEGFCYWHYWFAGKRLLARPFEEVLRFKKPDFPFCLAWANEKWSGIWHGNPEHVLIEQTYPGDADYVDHFYAVLSAFQDPRYLKIENKPVFFVYKPYDLPDPKRFTDLWRELALKAGLHGLYFIGRSISHFWKPSDFGFDAAMPNLLAMAFKEIERYKTTILDRICKKLTGSKKDEIYRKILSRPKIFSYHEVICNMNRPLATDFTQFPVIVPNWDNTPRSHINGIVIINSSPVFFSKHLREAIDKVADREFDKRVIFIKSWNEWAEGNYLEPDQKFAAGYLEVIKQELMTIRK